jgi:hypothetical protein
MRFFGIEDNLEISMFGLLSVARNGRCCCRKLRCLLVKDGRNG